MKILKSIMFVLMSALALQAGETNPPTFIKGNLEIRYNTRTQVESSGKPQKGATDVYTLNVNVANSAAFNGKVIYTPRLVNIGLISSDLIQNGSLNYDMACDVINPKNPSQSRNVGKIIGTVPINQNNVYQFENGSLRISVLPIGTARGFESRFRGFATGKPPAVELTKLEKLKKEAINISKTVNGKTITISVKKYDKMAFQSHVLAQGPVQIYPEATVNGEMLYDYARGAWYFQNVSIVYVVDGRQLADKLTGHIRWVEAPNHKISGEGEYQFDVRVNEPPPSESSVFAGASDESAFFETDTTIPALTGVMKYKDTMQGETVTASNVQVDLQGNRLTKQQAMYLCKLIMLSSIVPINAE